MPFLHPFMAETVEYYRLMKPLKPRDGVYPIMIKDVVPEISYYDKLELWTVDHPKEVDVWPDLDGNLYTVRNPQPPAACYDNHGRDCLSLFEANEGYEASNYYEGQKDDWIMIDFGDLSDQENLKLVLTTDYSINLQVLGDFQFKDGDGEWKTQLTISPHLLWATNVIDLSQWLPDADGDYKMRFYFTQPHRIDYLALDTSEEVPVKVEKLIPTQANHSKAGDVLSLILESDDRRAVTNGYDGDEMLLEFPYHPRTREDQDFWQKMSNFLLRREPYHNWERDFVFVGEGYYVQPDNPVSNGYLSQEDYLELKQYGYEGPEDYIRYAKKHSLYENYVKVEVTTQAKIASKGNDAYAMLDSSGYVSGYINGQSVSASKPSGWNHVALTYDKNAGTNNQKLYVNGVLKAQQTVTGSIAANTNALIIGDLFNGSIDEVRIWNVARSADNIRANMCKRLTGSESNLAGYWRLDETSGTSCADSGPNTNTGTMTYMGDEDHVVSGAALGDVSTYDYSSPSSVNLTSGYGDDVTVGTITNLPDGVHIYRVDSAPNVTTPPGDLDQLSQSHYFGVLLVGGSSPTYTLTYHYDGHPGIQNESTLELSSRSNNGTTSWTDLNATLDTGANTLIKTGQTGTEYILGSTGDNTLPAELSSFTVAAGDGEVVLNWVTESETESYGFNIHRSTNASQKTGGQFAVINTDLIPGAGNSSAMRQYEYVDTDVINGITYQYKLEDVDYSGNSTLHGPVTATPMKTALPDKFRLNPTYPNPFNPVTTITYDLLEDGFVELSVYNVRGEIVTTLKNGNQEAGSYAVTWDGTNQKGDLVLSGIYFLRIVSGGNHGTTKMIFNR